MRIFNSRDNECKSPFGSVREGENIHFKITIPRYLGCSSAILALKDDLSGDTVSYSMFWCGMPDENNEQWELDLSNISTGLYWYHFSLDTKQGRKYIMRGWGGEGYFSHTNNDPRYQLLCYDKDFQTPSWLPGGIMYQIFPDRFYFQEKKRRVFILIKSSMMNGIKFLIGVLMRTESLQTQISFKVTSRELQKSLITFKSLV